MVANAGTGMVWLLGLFLMAYSVTSHADGELTASVDRNKIYQTDSLNLRVTGNFEMEWSMGGILNFGRNQVGSPDISKLEQDFEILDQQQSYNMQSINGNTTSVITWNYTLAPKRAGALQIPPITYKNTSTEAIDIDVQSGSPPKSADTPPLVFFEVEIDKPSAYVQEQLVYTLRLFAADQLASGDWSEPEPSDAIVESLGDIKKFFRMAYNQRYEVRERKYLIFPQKSGTLTIEPQSFNGVLIDTRTRRRARVREFSEAIKVEIKAPPSSFSGQTWLPASSLNLTETWEQSPDHIKVGDSLTRTLELQSLGLLGSALPPMEMQGMKGLKIYPDQPAVESFEHQSGVQSVRKETTALVAVSPGKVNIPELKIPWWDTVNDVERVAVIPARTLDIQAGAGRDQTSPPTNTVSTASVSPDSADSNSAQANDATNGTDPAVSDAETGAVPVSNGSDNIHPWLMLIVLILIAWATTSWLLWQRLRQSRAGQSADTSPQTGVDGFKQLLQAVKKDDPNMTRVLVSWAQQNFPELKIQSIKDLELIDRELSAQASMFEAARYAASGHRDESAYQKTELLRKIESINAELKKAKKQPSTGLIPFYP